MNSRSGRGGDIYFLILQSPPQAQAIFAALYFHFRDIAFSEYLQQLFNFLVGHYK
jgi:hypothetical protein